MYFRSSAGRSDGRNGLFGRCLRRVDPQVVVFDLPVRGTSTSQWGKHLGYDLTQ